MTILMLLISFKEKLNLFIIGLTQYTIFIYEYAIEYRNIICDIVVLPNVVFTNDAF